MDFRRLAVIDIGSNTCRLVIYDVLGVALLQSFNEKAMAGLGRGLPETGMLSKEGRVIALEACRRYAAILKGLGVSEIYPVATAAVRVASDGVDFVKDVEKSLGRPVQVLSGPDEGRLSASGVVTGLHEVDGIVADLGGSSLELQSLRGGTPRQKGETHLLGPLAFTDADDKPLDKRRKAIKQTLKSSKILTSKTEKLYAVGGAWRNVAAVHMELVGYPLHILQGYKMTASDVREVIDTADFARLDKVTRSRLQRVAKRRYGTLLHTAIVLEALMKLAVTKEVIISANGLREGVVIDALSEAQAVESQLQDFLRLYLRPSFAAETYANELVRFCEPISKVLSISKSVVTAACYLADSGSRMHPDHRPKLVYDQALQAPYPKLGHADRLFVAHACASRYTFKHVIPDALKKLQSEADQKNARILGTALRLAGVFSGRSASILAHAALRLEDQELILQVGQAERNLVSETGKRRLDQLAGLLGLTAKIEFS
ncbi:MAG: Ppx/GppA family phosphatase [Pseudomonadota bacterium]